MENLSEILKEYNAVLNEMIENANLFEKHIDSMTEEQQNAFLKKHETLSNALENVARKMNRLM